MSNFTATGMFVPIAFALAATKAPITLLETRQGHLGSWTYEVRYRNGQVISTAEYTVVSNQLEVACDPGALVSDLIVALLHEVRFPDQALIEAQALADYVVDGGLLEVELVGGFHDGRILPDLPLDQEHFPPLELAVPLPRPWVAPFQRADDSGSVTYRRDRLDPTRRVWLYRFGK
jgi:hypothetical protein